MFEKILIAIATALSILVVLLMVSAYRGHVADIKFACAAIGSTPVQVIQVLGPPTEQYEEGRTVVMAWKKYHEAHTTFIQIGSGTMVPIHNPAYISGWKAVFEDGSCSNMEKL